VRELAPGDPAGVLAIVDASLTPDASAYHYTYQRYTSDLYLMTRTGVSWGRAILTAGPGPVRAASGEDALAPRDVSPACPRSGAAGRRPRAGACARRPPPSPP
jgi:hypothetical protein